MMEKTIGQVIREKRNEKGYTQEQLAERLSVTPQAVSKWENDSAYPDIALIKKLAKELGCSVGELLSEEKETGYVPPEKVDTSRMLFKIRVNSSDGDRISVNIPVKILEMLGENKQFLSSVSIGEGKNLDSALGGIDIPAILQMVSLGVFGKLVEVDSADGDHVEIYVE